MLARREGPSRGSPEDDCKFQAPRPSSAMVFKPTPTCRCVFPPSIRRDEARFRTACFAAERRPRGQRWVFRGRGRGSC